MLKLRTNLLLIPLYRVSLLLVTFNVRFKGIFFEGGELETIGTFEFISNKFTKSAEKRRKNIKIKTASKTGIRFGRWNLYLKFFLLGFLNIFTYAYSSSDRTPSRSMSFTEYSSIELIIFSAFAVSIE